jgi:hypothetical protein
VKSKGYRGKDSEKKPQVKSKSFLLSGVFSSLDDMRVCLVASISRFRLLFFAGWEMAAGDKHKTAQSYLQ